MMSAGGLHGVIGIKEQRSQAADGAAEGLRNHFFEPVGRDDFKVVVERAQDDTLCRGRGVQARLGVTPRGGLMGRKPVRGMAGGISPAKR